MGLTIVCFFSCSKDIPKQEKEEQNFSSNDPQTIKTFLSKELLEKAIEQKRNTPQGESAIYTQRASTLRSTDGKNLEIPYSTLVPEREFRDLLNSRGEIQVGDTVYCISAHGTFYSHKNNFQELRRVVDSFQQEVVRDSEENLVQIGNVYLFKTFANAEFNHNDIEH